MLKQNRRALMFSAGLLAAAAFLPAHAADKISVVTSNTGFLYATAYIASQMGYFKEADLAVTIEDGGGGSNAVAAVVGGGSHIGIVGIKNMSEAVRRGIDMKAIGTSTNGFPLALIYRSDMVKKAGLAPTASLRERVAVMKGGTIAVQDIGGSSGQFVRFVLSEAGAPSNHVTVINLGSNAGQLASLKARKIDGFTGVSPGWESAVADGYGTDLVIAARDIGAIKDMNYMIQAVRGDFLKKNAGAVERYLASLRRAQLLLKRDPARAKKAFYDYLASLTSSEPIPERLRDLMWAGNIDSVATVLVLEPKAIKTAREFFKIDPKVTDDQLVDNTLAAKVTQSVR